ncbi:phosphate ABC transporter substrate-binding protein PstS [Komagataeibacter medellinensis]|uniref:Phosphate-binding protein PstS n=1 Tax=Komagataeibacter medellinensis TaxID=1177712 RepID=A0ABQ6VTT8_9PROT|nr:phosphate ABC transporter substrate-binding protein PstS [Komagataeibacter medellinensis]KAB8123600.1 phosphate ABC transporter substrate-binding protein PstS [Komagataeibacter medellinensis]
MLTCALLATALPVMAHAADITGAGSSFAAPIYGAWGADARSATGVNLNYQTVGSSAGQNQILAGTVDFGASDVPMERQKLEAAHLFQFPTVMGGIVPVINLPGIAANKLQLDGPTLAAIYRGEIDQWNNPRIAALNPGLKLPDTAIATVHRADGSGTTAVFTGYLAHVSPEWREGQGTGASIAWPGGIGARGNDGVAASVRNTEGAIGYVEYAFAANAHMVTVKLKNHSGVFVSPDMDSFNSAAAAADWKDASHFAVDLLDTAGVGAWPIMSPTYVLVPVPTGKTAHGADVRKFFGYALKSGDAAAYRLDYVPVPAGVKTDILKQWDGAK